MIGMNLAYANNTNTSIYLSSVTDVVVGIRKGGVKTEMDYNAHQPDI